MAGDRLIGECAGFEVVHTGQRILFTDRGGRGLGIAAAVTGGLAGLLWLQTVLWVTLGASSRDSSQLLTGLATGVSAGFVSVLARYVFRAWRARRSAQGQRPQPRLIADLQQGMLLHGNGQPIAAISECRVRKAMLLTSSAPSVEMLWPGGKAEIFRGGLAGGGTAEVIETLRGYGFG